MDSKSNMCVEPGEKVDFVPATEIVDHNGDDVEKTDGDADTEGQWDPHEIEELERQMGDDEPYDPDEEEARLFYAREAEEYEESESNNGYDY